MSDFWKSVLTAFGMAAKDASPEELDAMVSSTASVLDAAPAEKAPAAASDAAPAPAADVMVERAPKGDDLGSKLDRVLELLGSLKREEEKKLSGEDELDGLLDKLAGKEGGEKAVTVPADEAADVCLSPGAKDAAVAILRSMRPVVAAIQDKAVRAQVTDALIASIRDQGKMGEIAAAAQAGAQKAADQAAMTSYEKRCADAQQAYAARNPHKRQEKEV